MSMVYYPIFFEGLDNLSEEEIKKNIPEIMNDLEVLYSLWGKIMHYSTDVENMLKEHLELEEGVMLGPLIKKFGDDSDAQKHPQLLLDLDELNNKCRIVWAHGILKYSVEYGKLIKHLVYTERSTGVEQKIEINNDYFDNVTNIVFPNVFKGLYDMHTLKDLKVKTPFIVPIKRDDGTFEFLCKK